ncbi:MAG: rRNA maturation RNase YbeY [Deltaproteobacteria bacterium]|nr:rRNA maturation RNase YbeY [Deltaproteobacteria bacterium]
MQSKTRNVSNDSDNLVDVARRGIRRGPSPSTIKRRACIVLEFLKCHRCELSIVLCNDNFIQQLNNEYRHKDTATDVLSFPLHEGTLNAPTDIMLGDIVISIETAERQAAELGGDALDETTSLLVHGILHLLGYTHNDTINEKKMNALALRVLQLF